MCVCVCVSVYVCGISLIYLARKAHAPYYTAICALSGTTILFHIVSQMVRLSGKKLLNKKCVLRFSAHLSENISHSKKT